MGTQSGRKATGVIGRLYQEPWRYSFFQAVRLIQNVFGRKKEIQKKLQPVGTGAAPAQEIVKFSSPPSMAYSTSDITAVSDTRHEAVSAVEMKTSFMGVAGTHGALPTHYTEFMLKRQRAKDTALRDFYDLFNHRAISLFYRAWQKQRLPFSYETHKVHGSPDRVDLITNALLAFVGRRVTAQDTRDSISNSEKILFLGGVYASSQRSPVTLAGVLSDYFKVPVNIEQFVGEWGEMYEDDCTYLGYCNGRAGQKNRLGDSAIIGTRVYCVESRFRIVIGPLKNEEFERVKPGSKGLHTLCEFARGYIGPNVKFDLTMKLDVSAASSARLKGPGSEPSNLGWNTWLISRNRVPKEGRVTEINIPSDGL